MSSLASEMASIVPYTAPDFIKFKILMHLGIIENYPQIPEVQRYRDCNVPQKCKGHCGFCLWMDFFMTKYEERIICGERDFDYIVEEIWEEWMNLLCSGQIQILKVKHTPRKITNYQIHLAATKMCEGWVQDEKDYLKPEFVPSGVSTAYRYHNLMTQIDDVQQVINGAHRVNRMNFWDENSCVHFEKVKNQSIPVDIPFDDSLLFGDYDPNFHAVDPHEDDFERWCEERGFDEYGDPEPFDSDQYDRDFPPLMPHVVNQSFPQLCPVGKEKRSNKSCQGNVFKKAKKLAKGETFTLKTTGPTETYKKNSDGKVTKRVNIRTKVKKQNRIYNRPPERFHNIALSSQKLVDARDVYNKRFPLGHTDLSRRTYRKCVQELFRLEALEFPTKVLNQGFGVDFTTVPRTTDVTIAKIVTKLLSTGAGDPKTGKPINYQDVLEDVKTYVASLYTADFVGKALDNLIFFVVAFVLYQRHKESWKEIGALVCVHLGVSKFVLTNAVKLVTKLTKPADQTLSKNEALKKSMETVNDAAKSAKDAADICCAEKEALDAQAALDSKLANPTYESAMPRSDPNNNNQSTGDGASTSDGTVKVQNQGLSGVIDIATGLVGLTTVVGAICGFQNLPDDRKPPAKLVNETSRLVQLWNGVDRAASSVAKVFKIVFQYLYYWVTGKEWLTNEQELIVTKASEWITKCGKFVEQHPATQMERNAALWQAFKKIYEEGGQLLAELQKTQYTGYSFQPFFHTFNAMRTIYQELSKVWTDKLRDHRPVFIWIADTTRKGKTIFTQLLTQQIMMRLGLEYKQDSIYERKHSNGQKFWDGYKEQFCTVLDDVFQVLDPQQFAEEFMDIIYMANEFQNLLNMADIGHKGVTYFCSSMLVCTTNRTSLSGQNSVTSVRALQERRDFSIKLDISNKYRDCCDEEVDNDGKKSCIPNWRKIQKKSGMPICYDAWIVEIYENTFDTDADPKLIERIPFAEFVDRVYAKLLYYQDPAHNTMELIRNHQLIPTTIQPTQKEIDELKTQQKIFDEHYTKQHPTEAKKPSPYIQMLDIKGKGTAMIDKDGSILVKTEDHDIFKVHPKDLQEARENLNKVEKVLNQAGSSSPVITINGMDGIYHIPKMEYYNLPQFQGQQDAFSFLTSQPDNYKPLLRNLYNKFFCEVIVMLANGAHTQGDTLAEFLDKNHITTHDPFNTWDFKDILNFFTTCQKHAELSYFAETVISMDFMYGLSRVYSPSLGASLNAIIAAHGHWTAFLSRLMSSPHFNAVTSSYVDLSVVMTTIRMTLEHYRLNPNTMPIVVTLPQGLGETLGYYKDKTKEWGQWGWDLATEGTGRGILIGMAAAAFLSRGTFWFDKIRVSATQIIHWAKYVVKNPMVVGVLASMGEFLNRYPIVKNICFGLAAAAIMYAAYTYILKPLYNYTISFKKKFIDDYFSKNPEAEEINMTVNQAGNASLQSGDPHTAKHTVKITPHQGGVNISLNQALDGNTSEVLNLVVSHTVQVRTELERKQTDTMKVYTQNGFFVCENQLIITQHMFPPDTIRGRLIINRNGSLKEYDINDLQIKRWPDADLMTVRLPKWDAPYSDMRKHFYTLSDWDRITPDAVLATHRAGFVNILQAQPVSKAHFEGTGQTPAESVRTIDGFFAKVASINGDCGGVYVAVDKSRTRKIMGIHTGLSSQQLGSGVIITQERLAKNLFEVNRPIPQSMVVTNQCQPQDIPFPPEVVENLHVFGQHDSAQIVPNDSKIGPSVVHGQATKSWSLPCKLGKFIDELGIKKDPYTIALSKWARKIHRQREDLKGILGQVLEHLPYMLGKADNTFANVVSLDEAINGREGTTQEQIEVKTGPGHPYVKMPHKQSGKKDWLICDSVPNERAHYHPSTFLEYMINEREKMAKEGIGMTTLWGDCLKDERKEKEKVMEGGTRLFCVGPVDLTINCRKYFMRFTDHVIKNRHRLPVKIGINPDGQEWKDFWLTLNRKQRRGMIRFLAGDFKKFDMSLAPWLTQGVADAILKWFELNGSTPEENKVREVLLMDVLFSMRLHGKWIYRCHQGVPSGHFLTAIFNSIVNFVIFKTCVFYRAKELNIPMDHFIFEENFSCGMVGDDHVCSMNPEIDWFDQVEYKRLVNLLFGMDYTDTSKGGDIARFTERDDLIFLQRFFRTTPSGDVFAPLRRPILDEEINWIRYNGVDSPETATWRNMDASLRGYMHWGRELFESRKDIYNHLAFENGLPPFMLNFDNLVDEWRRR